GDPTVNLQLFINYSRTGRTSAMAITSAVMKKKPPTKPRGGEASLHLAGRDDHDGGVEPGDTTQHRDGGAAKVRRATFGGAGGSRSIPNLVSRLARRRAREHRDGGLTQSDRTGAPLGSWQQDQVFVETDIRAFQEPHVSQAEYREQGQLGEIAEHNSRMTVFG